MVVRPAARRPLLAASGTLAAAALTAIALSAPAGPLGALLGEREEDPRPTSAGVRGGAPSAADIAALARDYSPGAGGWGSNWELSVWDVLYQQDPGRPGSVLAMLCEEIPNGPSGATTGAGTGRSAAGAGGLALVVQPDALTSSTSPPLGSGAPVGSVTSQQTSVEAADVGAAPLPPGTLGLPLADGDGLTETPMLEPVTPSEEPVTSPVEPVTSPVQPVTSPLEPVTKAVEPVTAPVVEAPEPVERTLPYISTEPQEPDVDSVKEPEVEKPEVEEPEVEKPEVEEPEVEKPEVEEPEVEEPDVGKLSEAADAPGADEVELPSVELSD